MTQWLTSNEKIITFVFNILQTLAIPVVLFLLNQHNEKRKETEQQKKEELERIKIYYEKNIIEYFRAIGSGDYLKEWITNFSNDFLQMELECNLEYYRERMILIDGEFNRFFNFMIEHKNDMEFVDQARFKIMSIHRDVLYAFYNDYAYAYICHVFQNLSEIILDKQDKELDDMFDKLYDSSQEGHNKE